MSDKIVPDELSVDEFTQEIQREFLTEALFLLETCEEAYLKLDDPEHRTEQLGVIFRAAHSLKGSGSAVGLTDLASFAHIAEDCLTILRASPHMLKPELISLLLHVGDALKARVHQLRAGDAPTWNVSVLRTDLQDAIDTLRRNVVSEAEAGDSPQSAAEGGNSPQGAPAKESDATAHVASEKSNTIKVQADRVESVLDMISELVVTSSQLTQSYKGLQVRNPHHESILQMLDKAIRELQDRAMSMRLTSVKPLFLKVQRTLRDTAKKLSKAADITTGGDDMEIDRSMIDLLSDPLIHLARNAIDNGIEMEDTRKQAGKPLAGKVHLSARRSGGNIIFEIVDDGAGVNHERVIKKAIERQLVDAAGAANMTDEEVYRLLFAPGFSTAERVTDISGRGVGLDVVRTNVEKLKGEVVVINDPGKGSRFRIVIPLTASITVGLLVGIGPERFIMPLDVVKELIRVEDEQITHMHPGSRVINVRGTTLPLVDSERALIHVMPSSESPEAEARRALVVEEGGRRAAVLVRDVYGQVQVVAKPLPESSSDGHMIAGTAILGDGRVALVLNVDEMLRETASRKVPTHDMHG